MTSCIDKTVSISSDPFLPFSSFSSPAKMFFEEIEVDGHRMRRFEQVG